MGNKLQKGDYVEIKTILEADELLSIEGSLRDSGRVMSVSCGFKLLLNQETLGYI